MNFLRGPMIDPEQLDKASRRTANRSTGGRLSPAAFGSYPSASWGAERGGSSNCSLLPALANNSGVSDPSGGSENPDRRAMPGLMSNEIL